MNHNSISEIRTRLREENIALKKRFGQNFLVDPGVRTRIGDYLEACRDSHGVGSQEVWEIGPGLGALTDEFLGRGVPLRLFEIDRGVIRVLRQRYGDTIPVEEGDFLNTFRGLPAPGAIVGNLPYHSAGAIVPAIVEAHLSVPVMVFLLQAEMVARFAGGIGTRSYSAVSALVQMHYTVERVFSVPPSAFYPKPRVESALASFRLRRDRPDAELSRIASRLARRAFSGRRKTLRNTLGEHLSCLEECGVDPSLRPEQLPPERFPEIARAIVRARPS